MAKVEALKDKLEQGLPLEQEARLLHNLAQTCENIRGSGESARGMYATILEKHPQYANAPEVAYRLGSLYNSVILEGTKVDHGKAIHYYEYVLAHCPPGRYVRLKARMSLGILRVYRQERRERMTYLHKRVERIKANALGKLVAACREPNLLDAMGALDDLLERHGDQPALARLIEEERNNIVRRFGGMVPAMKQLIDPISPMPGGGGIAPSSTH